MVSPKKGSLPQNIFTKPINEKPIPKIKLTNFEPKVLIPNGVNLNGESLFFVILVQDSLFFQSFY